MIRWFAINSIASNLLMGIIIVVGAWCYIEKVQPEVQPTMHFDQVRIDVNYRGGSPEDVESAVVIPIERAVENLPGIEEIESRANVGRGNVVLKTTKGTKPEDLLEKVKPLIDGITTFPQETEPPRYEIPDSSKWFDVIKIAVYGNMDEKDLLQAARRIRDDLTGLPGISQASIQGASPFELAIEADMQRLRDFGLTFSDLTAAIRRTSLDLPAGQVQTDEGALVIRSKNQAYSRDDFENIVVRNSNGAEVKLRDVAKISDDFEENRKLIRYNHKPALLVEVLRLPHEDALDIADRVKQYVENSKASFPQGIELGVWDDSSIELRGRIGSLLESLLQGSVLVLIILGLFLRPSIALWVVLGIPISFAGAFIIMAMMGMTLNPMSIFGFIIAVGIVVDDAIVTSENVFTKLKEGKSGLEAAIEGAKEVTIPVTFGAITISVAFLPLMFFEGFYGTFARQIPPVVIATILFSLVETKLALPCHLKNTTLKPRYFLAFDRFQTSISNGLELFIDRCYKPVILLATKNRYVTLAVFAAVAMVSIAVLKSGRLGFVTMPSIDRNRIVASLSMPRDTPMQVTDERVKQILAAAEELRKELIDPGNGKPIIQDILTSTGGWSGGGGVDSRQGFVVMEILDPNERSEPGPKNKDISKRWEELTGEVKDAQQFWISGDRGGGFGGGDDELEAIEVELRGPATEEKEAITDQITELMESYPGIQDAWTNDSRSRDELHVTIRPEGQALGLTQRDLANQVRAAFFGEEAQRIQRGRDDVRVMVRLPLQQRQSLHTLEEMRVLTPDGGAAPFRSVADARFEKAQSDIRRRDGAQVSTISAKPNDETVDVVAIADSLELRINSLLQGHPELTWRFKGYIREHRETGIRFWVTGAVLIIALYVLLAIPFRSILQPLFVMIAIPYAVLGALFGHLIMDITPSYLSIFGLLALAGVAINDSLVMVDFINQRRRAGIDLFDAVIQSGTRRFRPIFLTSATTFVGLIPTIFDKSPEAQFLNPMAVSIGFGMLFGTFITLLLVPSAYLAVEDIVVWVKKAADWYKKPFNKEDEPDDPEVPEKAAV
jgi:multidrug efflux pump subunit AcrB